MVATSIDTVTNLFFFGSDSYVCNFEGTYTFVLFFVHLFLFPLVLKLDLLLARRLNETQVSECFVFIDTRLKRKRGG